MTPDSDFNGKVELTYRVDDDEFSLPAFQSFEVTPGNDAPIYESNALATLPDGIEDTNLLLRSADLLMGFSDSESPADELDVVQLTSEQGSFVAQSDGWLFQPKSNVNGQISFSYQVSDGELTSDPVTRQFSLSPVNDSPVASSLLPDLPDAVRGKAQLFTTAELTIGITDPDGDVLIPHGFKAPSGSFVANEDGSVFYTPDESFFGDTVNIQYSVKDSDGLTVQASRQLFVSDRITGGFNLDVNKDGSVTALGDGLMVISELFANASSGESLTHYASTSNAAFSKSITHQFIQQGANVQVGDTYAALDVDRDGEVTASGDGLMVIRYLLGSTFTGSALTDNAISPHSLYDSQSRPWELVQENINALLPPNV